MVGAGRDLSVLSVSNGILRNHYRGRICDIHDFTPSTSA